MKVSRALYPFVSSVFHVLDTPRTLSGGDDLRMILSEAKEAQVLVLAHTDNNRTLDKPPTLAPFSSVKAEKHCKLFSSFQLRLYFLIVAQAESLKASPTMD